SLPVPGARIQSPQAETAAHLGSIVDRSHVTQHPAERTDPESVVARLDHAIDDRRADHSTLRQNALSRRRERLAPLVPASARVNRDALTDHRLRRSPGAILDALLPARDERRPWLLYGKCPHSLANLADFARAINSSIRCSTARSISSSWRAFTGPRT